jgi:alkylhydroperoxidase family enzyme
VQTSFNNGGCRTGYSEDVILERPALALPAEPVGDVWAAARQCFDDTTLAALVQVVALIGVFNRINVTTERTAEHYHCLAMSRSSG